MNTGDPIHQGGNGRRLRSITGLRPTFRAGTPTRLFEGDYLFPQAGRHYDVSADGQRFLMLQAVTEEADGALGQGPIVYVQNWLAELERRSPRR